VVSALLLVGELACCSRRIAVTCSLIEALFLLPSAFQKWHEKSW